MNKLFIIATLLTVSLCQFLTEPNYEIGDEASGTTDIFLMFKGFMAGLSPGGEPALCVKSLINGEDAIRRSFVTVKEELDKNRSIMIVLTEFLLKIIFIQDVGVNCKIYEMMRLFNTIPEFETWTSIGNQILGNVSKVSAASKGLEDNLALNENYQIGYNAGQFFSIVMKFNVS